MKDLLLGNTKLESRVILAPMAGITDVPFRKIVREMGNFLMFSEMVASQAVIRNVQRTHKMMDNANDDLTAVQLVGADPIVMAEAAKLSYDLGARFLDINMGCPVRKIVKSESGSALMKDEKLVGRILESVVNAVPIPVTLKVRLGWDMEHKNASSVAQIAEKSGIQMISVHARTRSQLYSGKADWKEVSKVKEIVNIPVIVNGDIINIKSAQLALEESQADGVMVGRGALGNPWVLKDIDNFMKTGMLTETPVSNKEKSEVLLKHLDYMFDFYGEFTSIKISRRVLMYYCHNTRNAAKMRKQINYINSKSEVLELASRIFVED